MQLMKHQKAALERYRDKSAIPLFFDPGTGKALEPNTPILTPDGWVPIKAIKIGDVVCGYDIQSRVTAVYHPTNIQMNKITFSDGTSVIACDDHRWWVQDQDSRQRWIVMTTKEIRDAGLKRKTHEGKRWDIPICQPIEFSKKELPIKPYTLGVLIGDGCIRKSIYVTTMDSEIIGGILQDGYDIDPARVQKGNRASSYTIRVGTSNIPEELNGYSYEKSIPHDYLFSSIEDRIRLLQGLIDTDGTNMRNGKGKNYRVCYSTTSPQLAEDIKFLVQSLGGIAYMNVRPTYFNGKRYRDSYRLTIQLPRPIEVQCCTVERKLSRILLREHKQALHRKISSIEPIGIGDGYCLTVDNDDATYLINDCIVTHNTATASAIANAKYEDGVIDAVLVIAPNKVDLQWAKQELPKYIREGLLTEDTLIYCNKKDKKPIPFHDGNLNIVCTNIDQFSTITAYKRYVDWANAHNTMIILDEATRIKNPKAKRTERLLYQFNEVVKRGKSIIKSVPKTKARAILTGTPITNGPFDVWAMFEFLDPGYFGINWYAFQNKFGMFHAIDVNGRVIRIPIGEKEWWIIKKTTTFEQANMLYGVTLDTYDTIQHQTHFAGPYKHVEQLRQLMMRDAMFVKIEDISDMPERTYVKRLVDMPYEQERIYHEMEEEMIATYKDQEVTAKSKLTMYLRLQQIASGFIVPEMCFDGMTEEEMMEYLNDPKPSDPQWIYDTPPKVEQLLIDMEEMQGQQVIIITHFSAEAQMLFDKLSGAGHKVSLQTGWKTVGSIEDFQNGVYNVMVANIRVLSMGFNLQNAHYMLFYSNTFSLEDRIQVEARIYRKGQTNRCIYYDYISKNTIDMKVLAALTQKKSLADYVRDKSAEECLVGWDKECEDTFEDLIF